jgi:hypothetical protein
MRLEYARPANQLRRARPRKLGLPSLWLPITILAVWLMLASVWFWLAMI